MVVEECGGSSGRAKANGSFPTFAMISLLVGAETVRELDLQELSKSILQDRQDLELGLELVLMEVCIRSDRGNYMSVPIK